MERGGERERNAGVIAPAGSLPGRARVGASVTAEPAVTGWLIKQLELIGTRHPGPANSQLKLEAEVNQAPCLPPVCVCVCVCCALDSLHVGYFYAFCTIAEAKMPFRKFSKTNQNTYS